MSAPDQQVREAVEAGEVLQGQLAGIEEQLSYLRALGQELQRGRAAIEALRAAQPGDEILVPLGGGAYARATLAATDRVVSPLGASYSAEGPADDALRRMDEQIEAARQAGDRLQEEGRRVLGQLQAIEAHLGQLTG